MNQVNPNSPWKTLAYVFLAILGIIHLFLAVRYFSFISNWDYYYYSLPLWFLALALCIFILGFLWCLVLMYLLSKDEISPKFSYFSIIPLWVLGFIDVLTNYATRNGKTSFVFNTIFLIFLIYDFAVYRTKKR